MQTSLIHNLFESRVLQHPHQAAIEEDGQSVGYARLNADANRLARLLRELGVGRDTIVNVFSPLNTRLVTAMLGVFKAGGVYLPMDRSFSPKRMAQVFTQTFSGVLLVAEEYEPFALELLAGSGVGCRAMLVLGKDGTVRRAGADSAAVHLEAYGAENPAFDVDPGDTNYIFYTSGSTGEGKAIAGSHRSLCHYVRWVVDEFALDHAHRVSHLSQVTFDASLKDIFMALGAGATLCIPPAGARENTPKLLDWLDRERISVMQCVPSVFRLLLRSLEAGGGYAFTGLRHVMLDGEALYAKDVQQWRKLANPHTELVNLYGTTETTILDTCHRIKDVPADPAQVIHVGKPIAATFIAILQGNRLCRIGETGDIYVKTPYLTKGYYGNEALTRAAFVPNPLTGDPADILYKTGDLGRYLADRSVEVLGRKDKQLKINGVRVELHEIERAVLACPQVEEVVVTPHTRPGALQPDLVCYYTAKGELPADGLRQQLGQLLNGNVMPAYCIRLDAFPLNSNGKIDKKALPAPGQPLAPEGDEACRPGVETALARIWQAILGGGPVGRNTSFFHVGGQSLKVIELISRVYQQFQVELRVPDVFAHPTIAGLGACIETAAPVAYAPVPAVEEQDYYAPSDAQQRLWLACQSPESSVAYHINGTFTLEGAVDVAAFGGAFAELTARHESLRTGFVRVGGTLCQRVAPPGAAPGVVLSDLSGTGQPGEAVAALARAEAATPFDLAAGGLVRARLVKTAPERYVFLLTLHHLIADAWSMRVLVKEMLTAYNALRHGEGAALPPLPVQYKDYSAWQRRQSGDAGPHRSYWLGQLAGEIPDAAPATDFPRPPVKTYRGGRLRFTLEPELQARLHALCRQEGSTLFMLLLAAVKALFYRYTGEKDVVLGTTIAGRDHRDLEGQIGFYVNTLALRTRVAGEEAFTALLAAVKKTVLGGFAHKSYPFERLVNELGLERDGSRSPLFNVLVELLNIDFERGQTPDMEAVDVGYAEPEHTVSKFDLTFSFREADGILLSVEFNTDLYRESRIRRLFGHLRQLLTSIAEAPARPLDRLQYLTPGEEAALHGLARGPVLALPAGQTVVTRWEAQAAATPGRVAVACGDEQLTYAQLNERANQLAHVLRTTAGVGPNDLVGLMAERSVDLVVGVWGILKAGGAFVPIDPAYPAEWTAGLLGDAQAKALVTTYDLLLRVPASFAGTLCPLDRPADDAGAPGHNPAPAGRGTDRAYVMYTSGSTGRPKGVAVTHGSLLNYLHWADVHYFGGTAGNVFGLFTSLSFDLTLTALMVPLLRGEKLVLCRPGETDRALLEAFGEESGVNTLKLTPSHVRLLNELPLSRTAVRTVILGGEAVDAAQVETLRRLNPGVRIYNEYGPTETTVGCTVKEIGGLADLSSIGRPAANASAYVLDGGLNLLPAGQPGEVCVGGDGVAEGYLNQPERTAGKFVPNPFGPGCLYRTGDLARWRDDGEMEFIGRCDAQVKLRGYRIEPGQVEAQLRQYPGVDGAVVVARPAAGGEKQLVAYYTGTGRAGGEPALRAFLAGRMPHFMVPAHLVPLAAFPLTANGKVDHAALPEPTGPAGAGYVAPRNTTEAKIAAVWAEVLGVPAVGVRDNFFDLGGHSLVATQVAYRLQKMFGLDVQLKDVFALPTVEGLAGRVAEATRLGYRALARVEEQDYYQVSPAQKRLWMLDQLEESAGAYNIPGAYVFSGRLDVPLLHAVFQALLRRHESLRTTFVRVNGQPRQRVGTHALPPLSVTDLRNDPDREAAVLRLAAREAGAPFDLESGPLVRLTLLRTADEQYVLLFTMHHIISDGWSMDVLIREWLERYNARRGGALPGEAPLPLQYKDYAAWQNQLGRTAEMAEHLGYWRGQLGGELPVLALPTDFTRPARKTYRGSNAGLVLDETLSRGLHELAQRHGASLFMTLLATLKALFHRHTGQHDLVIGTPVAGRTHLDVEDQIGFYVNTLALRTRFDPAQPFGALLGAVKETVLNAFDHQAYPFDRLVEELHLTRDLSRSPLFDVMLVLQYPKGRHGDTSGMHGVAVSGLDRKTTASKFDLQFTFSVLEKEIHLNLDYNPDLFTEGRMQSLLGHLAELVRACLRDESVPVRQLDVLPPAEKHRLLADWQGPCLPFPADEAMHTAFERQAAAHPEAIAVLCGDRRLTYGALNHRAGQWAHYLAAHRGIGAGDLVGLVTARSEALLTGMLAILKTGAAYVPIDPDYPAERIAYIREDAGLKLVLAENEALAAVAAGAAVPSLDMHTLAATVAAGPAARPAGGPRGSDLAYVIYTSGSTGKPKGVMITHGNAVGFLHWAREEFRESRFAVAYAVTSYCFDLSVYELFYPLSTGKTVRILESGLHIPDFLPFDEDVLVNTVPSVVKALLAGNLDFSPVRVLNMAGEPIPAYLKTALEGKVGEIRNLYGPSEDTTYSTCYRFHPADKAITIGRPIANTRMYIVDEQLGLLPAGAVGELCIAGAGLARGYLNRPELTAARFVPDPYREGDRLYRTGDYARWLSNGEIEFLGRKDNQVKVKGFRIELEEIQAVMHGHPAAADALVTAREDHTGARYLVAYYVAARPLGAGAWKEYLHRRLPAYMVPTHFVPLDRFPLTPNGKIDRLALPEPEGDQSPEAGYVAPHTDVERQLAAIWQDVLGLPRVGTADNFFVIGGDSIKALQIASRAHQQGYKLEVRTILREASIAGIALALRPAAPGATEEVTGPAPLTPIQRAFFAAHPEGAHHYNQAVMFHAADGLDPDALNQVLARLWTHHDMLRARYDRNGGAVVQRIGGSGQPPVAACHDLRGTPDPGAALAERADQLQRSMDLANGPLFKAALFRLADGDRLLLVAHHLVIDGVSWRILFEDFGILYPQYRAGHPHPALPPKTTSFREWSEKLSAYAAGEAFRKACAYWQELEQTVVPALPKDFPGGPNRRQDARTERFALDAAQTSLLLTRVNAAYGTEINDILLTALGQGVQSALGLDRVGVDLEGHGREEILADVQVHRTVGWFTAVYPVVLAPGDHAGPEQQLKAVKEHLHRVPDKGIGYGVWKYLAAGPGTEEATLRLQPEILFNYLGQFDADVQKTALQIAGEPAGAPISPAATRPHSLEITGAIAGGQLQVSIAYSAGQYRPETARRLARAFQDALVALIAHCAGRPGRTLTPCDLTGKGLTVAELDQLAARYPVEDVYPLSPMQEGFYFHALMNGDAAYFEQITYRLHGDLQPGLVRDTLHELFKRHDILRTAFVHEGFERPLQVVLKERTVDFCYLDITGQGDESAQRAYLESFKAQDKRRSFDLAADALLRVSVLRTGPATFECIWSYHHILLDGWCMSVLFTEYTALYNALRNGQPCALPAVKPYKYYIAWLQDRDQAAARAYWGAYLDGYGQLAGVPGGAGPGRQPKAYRQEEMYTELPASDTLGLKQLAGRYRVTVNTVVQALWGVLLARYNGRRDVVFGEVVSGRPSAVEGIETMVGLFINTVPVRIAYDADTTFAGLLGQVHQASMAGEPYHCCPLVDIQATNPLRQNLFDHILMLGNYPVLSPVGEDAGEADLRVSDVRIFEQVSYDLNVGIGVGEKVLIKFNYNANVYRTDALRRLVGHLEQLVAQVLRQPDARLDTLNLLTPAEQELILHGFNQTRTAYPSDRTLASLFEAQVAATPDATALLHGDQAFTYAGLNAQANRLAHHLRATYALRPGHLVGVMAGRSERMIIAILGILKAGAAYVPIDPEHPAERISAVLADAEVRVLLTDSEWMFGPLQGYAGELFALDLQLPGLAEPATNPVPAGDAADLAYLMYTSGSTGRPKGVAIAQKSVVRLVRNTNYTQLGAGHRVLQLSNYAFDGSVFDIFGALLNGATLCLVDKETVLSNQQLAGFIESRRINILFITTALFNSLVELSPACVRYLDKLYFGGEEASLPHIRRALQHRKHPDSVVHVYGPTESTTFSNYYVIGSLPEGSVSVPIGRPVGNTTAYVVDEQMQPVPVGVIGEICLGGDGLAREYRNQERLTAQKFVPHPFEPGERLYRTGDLGCWLPDGNIEFKGRKDSQVKIRGNRVELGEIENMLLACPGVEQVHLAVRKEAEGEKQLVAYYTGPARDAATLRAHLQQVLPTYMVPAYFVALEKLPLNRNGKVDLQALPAPWEGGARGAEYVAPATETEKALVAIWEKVLHREGLGTRDNFFLSGGDSIRAIRLVSAIGKEMGQAVEVKDVFTHQDVAALAAYLESRREADPRQPEREQAVRQLTLLKQTVLTDEELTTRLPPDWEDFFPMSDIQKGMLYYSLGLPYHARGVYHDQLFYQIEDRAFDYGLFVRAFALMVEKHPMLRTSFNFNDFPEEIQVVHTFARFALDVQREDLSGLDPAGQEAYLRDYCARDRGRPFAPGQPGLWRLRVFRLDEGAYGILLVIHHAIIDGWSEASLRTEFINAYYALKENAAFVPAPLKASYRDYVIAQYGPKRSPAVRGFWQADLAGYQRTPLPLDKNPSAPGEAGEATVRQYFEPVDPAVAAALQQRAGDWQVHVKMIYLAAFAYLARVTTAAADLTVGLVSNGRPEVEDGDKVVGCFLNTVPFRIGVGPAERAADLTGRINEKYNRLKQYDQLPLQEIVRAIGEDTTGGNPIFDFLFNYLDLHIVQEMHPEARTRRGIAPSFVKTNTHFDFTVSRAGEAFHLHVIYAGGLYAEGEVKRIFAYYHAILAAMSRPDGVLTTRLVMGPRETARVVTGFNDTRREYPRNATIQGLFEAVAAGQPDRVAIACQEAHLTYRQLDEEANRLAHYLRTRFGVGEGDRVAVLLLPSVEMGVALLAVLKAGAAYVPLDPDYPQARLQFMGTETAPKALITGPGAGPEALALPAEQVVDVYRDRAAIARCPASAPAVRTGPESLAYLMFTSGSTGRPKGVMVSHRAVVRLVRNTGYVSLDRESRLLLTGALSFDATTFETWGMLLNGGQLHLLPRETMLNPRLLKARLADSRINVLWCTSSWFCQLVDEDPTLFGPLKSVLTGGDRISVRHVRKLQRACPALEVIHCYGPTENTTFSVCHTVERTHAASIPLGRPITNSTLYVLDADQQPVPVGVAGELYVGGDGVALGYWQDPELTREKFVNLTLDEGGEVRLYRTGDYGKWLEDGTVAFLGRKDSQVKVRGYRVELGEIESVMARYEGLERVVVLARDQGDGDKQLNAYFTSPGPVDVAALRAHLENALPSYVVPANLVQLKAFPMTPTGKLDHAQLLAVKPRGPAASYTAPRNEVEAQLAQIWQEILESDQVGVHDNFFERGGHSLKATRMLARVHKKLDVEIGLKYLFASPTIEGLASDILAARWAQAPAGAAEPENYRDILL